MGPSVIVSVVHKLDIGGSIMGAWKAGVCALLHVFPRLQFLLRVGAKRMRGAKPHHIAENQSRNGSLRMKLGDADQAWRVFSG